MDPERERRRRQLRAQQIELYVRGDGHAIQQAIAAGGGQEMLNTAENVLAHKVAQAAVRTSREVQDKITGAALFAIRLRSESIFFCWSERMARASASFIPTL